MDITYCNRLGGWKGGVKNKTEQKHKAKEGHFRGGSNY